LRIRMRKISAPTSTVLCSTAALPCPPTNPSCFLHLCAIHPLPRGQQDIFVSNRPDRNAAWSSPVNAGTMINDPLGDDFSLRLSHDGGPYTSPRIEAEALGKATCTLPCASPRAPWSRSENLGPPLNTEAFEAFPTPSADGLTLFSRSSTFDSQDSDIWVSTRAHAGDRWSAPRRVSAAINSERAEFSPALSPDDNRLYFASERGGSVEVWRRRSSCLKAQS
jgi:WD40-like Beta Propeller Repeat